MKTKLLKKLRNLAKNNVQIVLVHNNTYKKYIIRRKENCENLDYTLLKVSEINPTEFIKCRYTSLNGDDFHIKIMCGDITAYNNIEDAMTKVVECRRNYILNELEQMRRNDPVINVLNV